MVSTDCPVSIPKLSCQKPKNSQQSKDKNTQQTGKFLWGALHLSFHFKIVNPIAMVWSVSVV